MNRLGKRLTYRLVGGASAILMGALAAAQATRLPDSTERTDETPPALHEPDWVRGAMIPGEPIMPGEVAPVQADTDLANSAIDPEIARSLADNPFTRPADLALVSHDAPPAQSYFAQPAFAMGMPNDSIEPGPAVLPEGMPLPGDAGLTPLPEPSSDGSMGMPEIAMSGGPSDAVGLPESFDPPPTFGAASPLATSDSSGDDRLADVPSGAPDSMPEIQFQTGPEMNFADGPASAPANTTPTANADPVQPAPQMGPATPNQFVGQGFGELPANPLAGTPPMQPSDSPSANRVSAMAQTPTGFPLNGLRSSPPETNSLRAGPPAPSIAANNTMTGPGPPVGLGTPSQSSVAGLPSLPMPESPLSNPRVISNPSGTGNESPLPAGYSQTDPTTLTQGVGQPAIPAGFRNPKPNFSGMGAAPQPMVPTAATLDAPGDRRLEGAQTPSVVIHKRAPAEVKVGQPATFVIGVRNVGTAEAIGVQVHDTIPAGMELVDAVPQPQLQGNQLVWGLGALPAGDERTITMQLVPRSEGELGSVATVTFQAAASVRTRATRPELKITQYAPEKVLIGQQLEIELVVANPGTGEATGVVLQEDVPEGFDHPRGRELDNALGNLRPGEERREILRLRATTPGVIENTVYLTSEDGLQASHTVAVEVVAPQLAMQLDGPRLKYLERQATYQLSIGNNGTAPATNVEIIAYLDRGFQFVSTENQGYYDPARHAVIWSLPSLPAGEVGTVPVVLLPIAEGEQMIRLEAAADLNTRAQSESLVTVQSKAELTFSIADVADPVEVTGETTYEIRVRNAGSRDDSNVQVQLQLPQGVEFIAADTEAQTDGRGTVAFSPRRSLPAGDEMTVRVRCRGVQAGTHIVRATVLSDQSAVPVTKEESTMFYADR
ncbi:MAG: hypothetical protein AAGD07_06135 [Planctomycetota bacterium]